MSTARMLEALWMTAGTVFHPTQKQLAWLALEDRQTGDLEWSRREGKSTAVVLDTLAEWNINPTCKQLVVCTVGASMMEARLLALHSVVKKGGYALQIPRRFGISHYDKRLLSVEVFNDHGGVIRFYPAHVSDKFVSMLGAEGVDRVLLDGSGEFLPMGTDVRKAIGTPDADIRMATDFNYVVSSHSW